MPPIWVGTLDVLPGTGTEWPNVLVDPRARPPRSRYFAAIVPLPVPFGWGAMSLPAGGRGGVELACGVAERRPAAGGGLVVDGPGIASEADSGHRRSGARHDERDD